MLQAAIKQITALFIFLSIISYSSLINASPNITNVAIQSDAGNQFVVAGAGFSTKTNPKPLLWWHADGGEAPDPISRNTWAGDFMGTISTTLYSEGSKQSYYLDHGVSNKAVLSRVEFNSDKLFMFRKLYEDFDVTKDFAIRVRGRNLSGGILASGMRITGKSSGATGTIRSLYYSSSSDRYDILLKENTTDTVNLNPPIDFIYGETITADNGATFTNAEGSEAYPTGTYRTFNYKTFRIWGDPNNSYPVAQGKQGAYNFNHAHTDVTHWSGGMPVKLYQLPRVWQYQEFVYRASDINTKNGHFEFAINGTRSIESDFISTTTDKPVEYNRIYQSQVSNGAKLGSRAYYDSLYIDDTWHRVMLCDQPSWENCTKWEVQIPVEWSDSQITLNYRLGSLTGLRTVYMYVFDEKGNHNIAGHEMAINFAKSPPKPPSGFSATVQ